MHFMVPVLSKTPDGYKELLDPYGEKKQVEFRDITDLIVQEWKGGKTEVAIMPDGSILPKDKSPKCKGRKFVFVPTRNAYPTFADYIRETGLAEQNGRYGFWYNPKARYRWYVLGGRWRGMLLVKDEVPGTSTGYKWVDLAQVKDIEWDLMTRLRREKGKALWQECRKSNDSALHVYYGAVEGDTEESYANRYARAIMSKLVTPDGVWHDEEFAFNFYFRNVDPELYLAIVDCREYMEWDVIDR